MSPRKSLLGTGLLVLLGLSTGACELVLGGIPDEPVLTNMSLVDGGELKDAASDFDAALEDADSEPEPDPDASQDSGPSDAGIIDESDANSAHDAGPIPEEDAGDPDPMDS